MMETAGNMSHHPRGLDEVWLSLQQEAPIDPDRPVVDSYHHAWELKRGFPYTVADFARDATSGHNVVASVFVTSGTQFRNDGPEHLKPAGETEWVHRQAADYARTHPGTALCDGIVGHVDLKADPALVDEALEAHKSASYRFKGIRQSATWSDDDEVNKGRPPAVRHLYLDPAFRRGFARFAKHGLTFDAYVFHDQMSELVDLAKAFPDVPIICDHLCAPLGQGRWAARKDEVLADWKRSIKDLASLANVHMKLGGSAMPMFGFAWTERPLPPSSDEMVAAAGHFYRHAIDTFSPARCMFESNFPVDKLACGYVPLWNSFKKIASNYSASEQAGLLCDTAARVYTLAAKETDGEYQHVAR